MQRTDIENKLQAIHSKVGNDDPMNFDESFDQNGYDSLDKVEFVIEAEKAFGITIDNDLMYKIQTPNDVVEFVMEIKDISTTAGVTTLE